jgi:hypothetical protein
MRNDLGLLAGSLIPLALGSCATIVQDVSTNKQPTDVDKIAEELSNPTTALGSLANNFDYTQFDGDLPDASSQDSLTWLFQPVLPYPLGKYNLAFRPAVPILISQPVFDAGAGEFEDEKWNLGDIGFDLVLGTTTESGLIYSAGLVGGFPTASNDAVGTDAWSVGPEVLLGVVKDWGLVGLLLGHQWDYAGDDDKNLTTGQYFYALPLPSFGPGWQFFSGPAFSYNHEAPSDDAFALPLGVGLSKTMVLGGRPWKFQLQYWHYVESPDAFGQDWQIRFTVTPVIKLPW